MRDFNKIYGSLVGGAAGDALGYAVEFDKEDCIFGRFGSNGITEYELKKGRAIISDDTQMTLFTAEGILLAEDPNNYDDYIHGVYDAYQEWFRTQNFSREVHKNKIWLTDIKDLHERRMPGITCLNALESKEFGSIFEPLNNSKGCGGVMRVAPIGLFYSPDEMDWEEIDTRGAQAAALTHGHPQGYISAAGLVHIVNLAMYRPEMTLLEIMEDMIEKVPTLFMGDDPEECEIFKNLMQKAVDLATKDDIRDLDAIHMLGEGWVGEEALAIAMYCALKHENDFNAAMIAAVNHKGDSDSTGAIAGNILGAYIGFDAIPAKYTEKLELMDVIKKVAQRLANNETEATRLMSHKEYMKLAIEEAYEGIKHKHGGPFGSIIIKDGKIIGRGHNRVLINKDATCHGEMEAIRDASKKIGSHDLSGAILYTTAAPCPMCKGAILWSNISEVYYGCNIADTDQIGFRDEVFYEKWNSSQDDNYGNEVEREACLKLFGDYAGLEHELY